MAKPTHGSSYVLDERELATVLAALRCWQSFWFGGTPDWSALADIVTKGHQISSLTGGEIDELCERLNTGG